IPPLHTSFFYRDAAHPDLPSFPTRRSSDLGNYRGPGAVECEEGPRGDLDQAPSHQTRAQSQEHRRYQPGGLRGEIAVLEKQRDRSEEHTSELQSRFDLVCRLLLEKKKKNNT